MTSIAVLNLIGVTYSYWSSNLPIMNSIATGKMDPAFCNNYSLDTLKGNGKLTVTFDDKYTMNIQGQVDTDYQAILNYSVKNDGSIPVKFISQRENINDGVAILVYQESKVMNPGENYVPGTGNPQLQFHAGEEGTYNFEIELLFEQWNRYGLGEKKLIIRGNITVMKPEVIKTEAQSELRIDPLGVVAGEVYE